MSVVGKTSINSSLRSVDRVDVSEVVAEDVDRKKQVTVGVSF